MKSKFFSSSHLSLDLGLLILRLFAGGLMLTHGVPKLQKLLAGNFQFADPLGFGPDISLVFAVLAEGVCSVLLILGLFTRLALIPLILTMMVAFFIVHSADPLNIKETALLYMVVFISLFFTGPGDYSIDGKRSRSL